MRQSTLHDYQPDGIASECPVCGGEPPKNGHRKRELVDHLYHGHELMQEEVAERLDCSRSTIWKWFDKHDIQVRQYGYEIPKPKLRELYVEREMSVYEVAEKFDCSDHTILTRLKDYGIETRGYGREYPDSAKYRNEERLRELYYGDGLSVKEIGEKFSVSRTAITSQMEEYGIERRSHSEAQTVRQQDREYLDKENLQKMYWEEEMTTREIADEFDVTQWTISNIMNQFDIQLRYGGMHGNSYETDRGEYVRSSGERTVANHLYDAGIDYIYEPDIDMDLRPDFYANGTYIEYWGMVGYDEYRDRMADKMHMYRRSDVDAVHLFPQDLDNIDKRLSTI